MSKGYGFCGKEIYNGPVVIDGDVGNGQYVSVSEIERNNRVLSLAKYIANNPTDLGKLRKLLCPEKPGL